MVLTAPPGLRARGSAARPGSRCCESSAHLAHLAHLAN